MTEVCLIVMCRVAFASVAMIAVSMKQLITCRLSCIRPSSQRVDPQGEGEKLSELPNVAFKLSKLKARDKLTEMIHMLLFKRKGEVGGLLSTFLCSLRCCSSSA